MSRRKAIYHFFRRLAGAAAGAGGRRGNAGRRKAADRSFGLLVSAVALVSVLALGAIVIFVFFQGTRAFFAPTAPGPIIVQRNIPDITVNGERHLNRLEGIMLPEGTRRVEISFPFAGGEENLVLHFDPAASGRYPVAGGALRFERLGQASMLARAPEPPGMEGPPLPEHMARAYEAELRWPGAIAALAPRLHVILPEPPYGFFSFVAGREWRPTIVNAFGILPMIAASAMAAFGAVLLGVPLALLCAVFMSEFIPDRLASAVRSGIELLAGIPSVVYGFFGLMVIVPAVREAFGIPVGNTLLSATLVLSLMILPTVTTIAETSLRAVPRSVREASLALGASKMQTAWRVVVPHANSGVIAGVILGMSRAIGETMAVILVAGNSPQLTISPLESVRTLTATIALEMGYADGRHSEMLFSIGVVLFSMILILNGAILAMRRRMERL